MLSALHVEPVVLGVIDVLVTISSILSDPTDPRAWQDRLEDAFRELDPDIEAVSEFLNGVASGSMQAPVEAWVRKVHKVGYQAFARRLLGSGQYARLERALREDAALVALAVRRGVRAAMPLVVAWEDALSVMTKQQLSALTAIDVLGLNIGKFVFELDAVIGEKILPSLPIDAAVMREAAQGDVRDLTEVIRENVSSSAARQLTRLNERLVRKLAGARDALEHSADGVAQAASSLIELIDRVLREAQEQVLVLEWIDRELPEDADLTYLDDVGARRPTKRGELLCFLYAGGTVKRAPTEHDDGIGPLFIHQVIAGVIVSVRSRLQRLKHADDASEDERAQLESLLSAIEGALMLGMLLQRLATGPGLEVAQVVEESA